MAENAELEIVESTDNRQGSGENNLGSVQERKIVDIEKQRVDIFEILKLVSPGTSLRIALDDILRAENGALVLVMNDNLKNIFEGGFKVNCKFTPQRLTELAKMDGAVILSEDLKKILYANVLIVPDPKIPTSETGTRHKAAERSAKQTGSLAIAVSERRRKITLFYADTRYVLRNAEEILRRATETLQILEKQREIYDELLGNLNVLEITGLVSMSDVCNILQRTEMINRISESIKRNIVELGKDGSIIKMRLRELTRNIEKTEQLITKDYAVQPERVKQLISEISFDDLLDTEVISKLLFNKDSGESVYPRGYRLLLRAGLQEEQIKNLVTNFKQLPSIFNADFSELVKVLANEEYCKKVMKEISALKESIMVGKKI